jgi:hypothetical protein
MDELSHFRKGIIGGVACFLQTSSGNQVISIKFFSPRRREQAREQGC